MKAIDLLVNRQSCARLAAPAPEGAELEQIWQAGLRAPDHGGLKPWRFIHVAGEGLDRLSYIFAEAAESVGVDPEKAKDKPYRAPVITIVIASPQPNDKVPLIEQQISAGCATHAMQMAAVALGYNGMWRTGPFAYSQEINQALELAPQESIVGFLYLGTAQVKQRTLRAPAVNDYLTWL